MANTQKMNAEFIQLTDKHIVIARPVGYNLAYPNILITVEGAMQSSIAKGIVRMLNEDQCPACGKFNGLHGEIYHATQQDSGGEVRGYYGMCPNAENR